MKNKRIENKKIFIMKQQRGKIEICYFILTNFIIGSVPFPYLIGKIFLKQT